MNFETVTFSNGTSSLRELASGQTMHSSIGPMEEAEAIYVRQTGLKEKLLEKSDRPLVVHDVGMGIAANVIAAINCAESIHAQLRRPLHIVSFEKDLTGLELAIREAEKFPFFSQRIEMLQDILRKGFWMSCEGSIRWSLLAGDYRLTCVDTAPPEVVFYDFYSPAVCPELWSRDVFQRLFNSMKPLRDSGVVCRLSTYSAATPIRLALLLAGFHVGHGLSTSRKTDTTIASTRLEDLDRPLGPEWLERKKRAHAR